MSYWLRQGNASASSESSASAAKTRESASSCIYMHAGFPHLQSYSYDETNLCAGANFLQLAPGETNEQAAARNVMSVDLPFHFNPTNTPNAVTAMCLEYATIIRSNAQMSRVRLTQPEFWLNLHRTVPPGFKNQANKAHISRWLGGRKAKAQGRETG